MKIRWLQSKHLEPFMTLCLDEGWLVSSEELSQTLTRFPHLCYGVFDEERLVGGIMGYLHNESAWIGNFIVDSAHRKSGLGTRLFSTLLDALKAQTPTIYLNAATEMEPFYAKHGFVPKASVGRFTNHGKSANFTLSTAALSSIQNENASMLLIKMDKEIYLENRFDFLQHSIYKSSLFLSTARGVMHSRIYDGKNILIAPWYMYSHQFSDAEKLMRGLLHIRGLKSIYADVPLVAPETLDLYAQYGFEQTSTTTQMVYGENRAIKYENIYAMPSSGAVA